MLWAAVIAAAGTGSRFGRPKQFVDVAGAPMLAWSLNLFARMPEIVEVIIVTEPENVEAAYRLGAGICDRKPLTVVHGGATRQASVRSGLDAMSERCTAVLVHDGARPLVRTSEVRSAMRVVRDGIASLLGAPAIDTMKVVQPDTLRVMRTLDRKTLWAAQTPQCATARDLRRAHLEALRDRVEASDDAMLLERSGVEVVVVEASAENFKITNPEDLARADALLRERVPISADEQEILLLEVFVDDALTTAVCEEVERRGGTVDGIDRELPSAVVIRAYLAADRLEGFGERFEAFGSGEALFTTHFSHVAPRAHAVSKP